MHCCVLLLPLWLLSIPLAAVEPTIIELGGPRKAAATIRESENDYEVEVRLIPVRCFDPGMNRRLSQVKARVCAVEALTRHLGGGRRQPATIENMELGESRVVDSRFVLIVKIPRKGVSLARAPTPPPSSTPSGESPSRNPLKAKDDFLDTLALLAETMTADLPQCDGDVDKFLQAIADTEELGLTRLATLRKDIKTDRWLLAVEREDLLTAVELEESRLLKILKERVGQVDVEVSDESE